MNQNKQVATVFRQYIFASLSVILLIGLAVHFWIFRETINHTADETLHEYETVIKKYAFERDTLLGAYRLGVKEDRLHYMQTTVEDCRGSFMRDTMIQDSRNGKLRKFRVFNFPLTVKGTPYRAEVSLRTLGSHDHFRATLFSYICVLGLLALFVFLLVHFLTRKILNPFYAFMDEVRHTDLKHTHRIVFSPTEIEEFNELYDVYKNMFERIQKDYQTMKELSDNISHELQTPLAIMRSKTDLLLQKNQSDEESVRLLQSLQTNINRLSRFNRSLMLLTRIGNHAEGKSVAVDLTALCEMKLQDYAEMLEMRDIASEISVKEPFCQQMYEPLAEVLINNLLSNAMKYNLLTNGFIRITSYRDILIIENPFIGTLPEGDLFERFIKNKEVSDSNGLGLAIVKAICDKFGLVPLWEVDDNLFRIRIMHKKAR